MERNWSSDVRTDVSAPFNERFVAGNRAAGLAWRLIDVIQDL